MAPAWCQTQPPYALPNSEVHTLHAKELKRDYDIMVSLPVSYKTPYAFPVSRAIGARVGDTGGGLEEFIVVGLGYAKGDTPSYSRRGDYTPTENPDNTLRSDMPGRPVLHGQAEGYRRFIASEVLPLIARQYRADMTRKIFSGHSYGSLLGIHMLFSEPAMFEHYILGSPSLWYGKRVMFEREKAYAATHKDLKASVYFGVGQLERKKPGDSNTEDMVGDMKQFESLLKSRRYPGLRIESRVFADEDHFTVAPHIITRALKWMLPPAK